MLLGVSGIPVFLGKPGSTDKTVNYGHLEGKGKEGRLALGCRGVVISQTGRRMKVSHLSPVLHSAAASRGMLRLVGSSNIGMSQAVHGSSSTGTRGQGKWPCQWELDQ